MVLVVRSDGGSVVIKAFLLMSTGDGEGGERDQEGYAAVGLCVWALIRTRLKGELSNVLNARGEE